MALIFFQPEKINEKNSEVKKLGHALKIITKFAHW